MVTERARTYALSAPRFLPLLLMHCFLVTSSPIVRRENGPKQLPRPDTASAELEPEPQPQSWSTEATPTMVSGNITSFRAPPAALFSVTHVVCRIYSIYFWARSQTAPPLPLHGFWVEVTAAWTSPGCHEARGWVDRGTNPTTHVPKRKVVLWCSEDKQILSADDKTLRFLDYSTKTEVKSSFKMSVSRMEYIPEGEILVITYGRSIAFHNAVSLDPIKSFEAPVLLNSASLHPEKEFLVAGGEDCKLYKYDYNSGEELESYKVHFGPIHCLRFSPDGELYASGSEDGTLRLWQTVVGKTYDLWKCLLPEEDSGELAKPKISFPETAE
ncbi:LOW QUALITY PROTEIN: serine-threonine kinase receptor-associated protein-like [Molossus nigricans]